MQYYDASKNFNLSTHTDAVISPQKPVSLTETFDYDVFGRIVSTQLGTAAPKLTGYSATGNITNKSDAGSEYIYADPLHVHAVTTIKSKVYNGPGLNDPLTESCDINREQQDITYTAFNQPWVITQSSAPSPDVPIATKQLTYTYDLNNQRIKATYKEGATIKYTRYYFGNMEYEKDAAGNIVRQVHYVNGPTGLIAMLVRESGIADKYFIPYKDHAGSIVTVTDEAGNKVAEQSFDAWGKQRNPYNWSYSGFTPISTGTTNKWLYRGFTGHEHVPQFDLVNMNGRMYDPVVGRMLSPDNFVHDAYNSQHFNRYSYVWNNPVKFTDPGGQDGWSDYEDWDREDRDDNRDETDEDIPEGYHVEDGILYQDVFEALDGTVYHDIEVGSWNGDNGEDDRNWNDFQQEAIEYDHFVLGEERDDRDERDIHSQQVEYDHSFLNINIVKITFEITYTIDKEDNIEIEDITSTFEGVDPPFRWQQTPWTKGKSEVAYTKDGRTIVKAEGTIHTGLGAFGYSKTIEGTFTIDRTGIVDYIFSP
ncbi:MAG: hypothetical protein JWN78_1518 [Bacteroidota bacterium]|nr:hypothetical protein [Bacteroidota bacterium]